MNFDIHILGTSGMMPLVNRYLTSAVLQRQGELFLFDCGEGTQVALKKMGLRWKQISTILITHMHADHVTGLPGLLMLSSQVNREEPLYIYGPKKIKDYVLETKKMLDMYINYEIIIKEIEEGLVLDREDLYIECMSLDHTKPCLAYNVVEKDRSGEFFPDLANKYKVPMGRLWGKLQKGESVLNSDNQLISSDMVCGKPRKGRKFSYVTDTKYLENISTFVKDADILICESMFEKDLIEDASKKKHLTSIQSATIAKDANVKRHYMTHYSPRYANSELKKLLNEARTINKNTHLGKDGLSIKIPLLD